MEIITVAILIIATVFASAGVLSAVYFYAANKTLKKQIDANAIKQKQLITVEDSMKTITFIDSLLLIKFQYYLNTYILAYFMSEKEIDKKEIKQLKEDFYMDISKTLNSYQQEQILKVFSKEGIILYIHQTFLRMLNDANIKFKSGDASVGNMSRRSLEAIYS
jgi:hypothetical protein